LKAAVNINPKEATEVFLILHEQANRPADKEFEYMTGQLRDELERKAYSRVLTEDGEQQARAVGKQLKGVDLQAIVTEDFSVPRETALIIAEELNGGKVPIITDPRIRESNLSYLTPSRFQYLSEIERAKDPNAVLRDWMRECPDDYESLVLDHVSIWNEFTRKFTGKRFAFVLHVEGFLLYPVLLLGLGPGHIGSIHIPRGHPVHARLLPDERPVISIGDEQFWRERPRAIFGQWEKRT